MTSEIKLASFTPQIKNLFFIDGITRSGKFWLSNFIGHFDNTEHTRHEPFMEHISIANYLGRMSDDACISILHAMLNLHTYENAIGRNINFKFSDSSSIFKNPKLQEYLQRTFQNDRNQSEVFEEIKRGERICTFLTHDWLSIYRIQPIAFETMKVVRIERNPVDLVFAWYNTGIGKGEMTFGDRVHTPKGTAPWFAFSFINEYDEMNEMDRIIKSILWLDKNAKENFKSLSAPQQKRFFFTSYENLATEPIAEAERIAAFMGTKVSNTIYGFAAQPVFKSRDLKGIAAARSERLSLIEKYASPSLFHQLLHASEQYTIRE